MNGERWTVAPHPPIFQAKYVMAKGLEVGSPFKFLILKSRALQRRHFIRVARSIFAKIAREGAVWLVLRSLIGDHGTIVRQTGIMIGKLGKNYFASVFRGLGEIWWVRGLDFQKRRLEREPVWTRGRARLLTHACK